MKTKYLSDGRKVAVIGELNQKEKIVQEIFVTEDGDELPGGERFVSKSLHDDPVKSYKAKEEEKREKRISLLASKEKEYNNTIDDIKAKLNAYKEILKNVEKFIDVVPESELDTFTGFLTGSIKYIVVHGYRITAPQEFIDNIISWDTWRKRRYDGIKLISVFGKSKGDMEYRIHQYSDNSGGHEAVSLFNTYDEAVDFVRSLAVVKNIDGKLSETEYNMCLNIGINFSESDEKRYKKVRKKELNLQIEKLKNEVDEKNSRLSTLIDSMKEV